MKQAEGTGIVGGGNLSSDDMITAYVRFVHTYGDPIDSDEVSVEFYWAHCNTKYTAYMSFPFNQQCFGHTTSIKIPARDFINSDFDDFEYWCKHIVVSVVYESFEKFLIQRGLYPVWNKTKR